MLHRISNFAMVALFLAALLIAGGAASPAHAAGEATYIEEVVHAADIDHITTLIHDALDHLDGLSLADHDIVYEALGRTNTALDLLYNSGATGDVFNTAEHLLLTQRELLQEVEQATLTGNLADLSTVTPLLVDLAQARLSFERQAFSVHDSHLPLTGSHLSDSLFSRQLFLSDHSFLPSHSFASGHSFLPRHSFLPSHSFASGHSFLPRHSFASSRLFLPRHSFASSRLFLPRRSFLGHDHSLHSHSGRSLLELRRGRFFNPFGYDSLYGTRSRYFLYGR